MAKIGRRKHINGTLVDRNIGCETRDVLRTTTKFGRSRSVHYMKFPCRLATPHISCFFVVRVTVVIERLKLLPIEFDVVSLDS
ncbi:hypothetical protein SDJN03_25549, partial [Cucurbita argyrosperma subsp. sororia]